MSAAAGDGFPRQGTTDEQAASALDDQALAAQLDTLRRNRHAFSKARADAFLFEAARRLRWGRQSEVIG